MRAGEAGGAEVPRVLQQSRSPEFVVDEAQKTNWSGREVSWGLDQKGIALGQDKNGAWIVMRWRDQGVEAFAVDGSNLCEVESRYKNSLSEWLALSPNGYIVDRSSIPADVWSKSLTLAEATEVMLKAKCIHDRLMPDPPITRYKGEKVFWGDDEYYVIVTNPEQKEVVLGRVRSDNGLAEVVRRPMNEVVGYGHPIGKFRSQNKIGQAAQAPVIVPSQGGDVAARYTRAFDVQKARDMQMMDGMGFYEAGRRIDGSVIQHCPGSEILVVDFERDPLLLSLYDEIMVKYEASNRLIRGGLPAFIQREIQSRFAYNVEVVDALAEGRLAELLNDPNFTRRIGAGRNKNIHMDQIREAAKLGAMQDKKLPVGIYIGMGVMVCNQMGVIEAGMMERAIDQGRAKEYVGVEIRANMDKPGGHLWAVLLNQNGKEEIYDPAMRYHGKAEWGRWNYKKGYENHIFGKPGT